MATEVVFGGFVVKITIKDLDIKEEYCECGCHGNTFSCGLTIASIVPFYFWMYDDLRGKLYLHDGHGPVSRQIGVYSSYKEVRKVVEKLIIEDIKSCFKGYRTKKEGKNGKKKSV